jgi:hypothetical protein
MCYWHQRDLRLTQEAGGRMVMPIDKVEIANSSFSYPIARSRGKRTYGVDERIEEIRGCKVC